MSDAHRGEILDALRLVIDPELGIDIVDLGLVYEAEVSDDRVHVMLAMTTPARPLGESMAEEARAAVRRAVGGMKSVTVDLVSEPRWQPSMMSAEARERLGWR